MFTPVRISLGNASGARLEVHVDDYEHPERAEPANLDLMHCRVRAHAGPLEAGFDMTIGLWEFFELREYLQSIASGNGPSRSFALAGGLLALSFAPSKRGPVLCAVFIKTIDASHVRLEFLITLEPSDISRSLFEFNQLFAHAGGV